MPPQPPRPVLTLAQRRQIDDVCVRFDAARAAGGSPRIEDFLPPEGDPLRADALQALLEAELDQRHRAGEAVSLGDYLRRFPEHTALVARACQTQETVMGTLIGGTLGGETSPPPPVRYERLGLHASGGLGAVYLARDAELRRTVALKEIRDERADDPDARSRFLFEAEVTGSLEHPGIVPVYGLGVYPDGRPFYAMRFVHGESMKDGLDRLHAAGPCDWRRRDPELRRLLRRFLDVCNSIAYAHSRGVIHRDIKPANVMLGQYGETLVVDWGLAKRVGEPATAGTAEAALPVRSGDTPTQIGQVVGTPAYASPEQLAARPEEVGRSADVYALGATLYYLLTGRPPIVGGLHEILTRAAAGEFPSPRQVNPAVPRELDAVCMKCLQTDPRRRYRGADALADDLGRFLDGEPVEAAGAGLIDRITGAMDRVPLQSSLASSGALLLWLAPVMALPEVWITLATRDDGVNNHHLSGLAQFGRAGAFLLVVGLHRGWRLLPRGPVERQLWMVWGGYVAACFGMAMSLRLAASGCDMPGLAALAWDARMELVFYPALAALAALAFFSLSGSFWGYCALIGLGFLALAFVMAIDLRWAPLEFGAAWASVLVLLGLRLRRLGRGG